MTHNTYKYVRRYDIIISIPSLFFAGTYTEDPSLFRLKKNSSFHSLLLMQHELVWRHNHYVNSTYYYICFD